MGLKRTILFYILLAFRLLFLGVSPTLIWPWEGPNYPSRSCNGRNRPKGPKLKKNEPFYG